MSRQDRPFSVRPFSVTRPICYDLSETTAAEELFLWRLENGLNQVAAAERLGVRLSVINSLENGKRTALSADDIANLMAVTAEWHHETRWLLILARRRSGETASMISADLGVSRVVVNNLERAGSPRLVAYWEGRGFKFPRCDTGISLGYKDIDTSDIPEADEAWFARARLVLPTSGAR